MRSYSQPPRCASNSRTLGKHNWHLNKSYDTGVFTIFKSTVINKFKLMQNRLPINQAQLTLLRIINERKKSTH